MLSVWGIDHFDERMNLRPEIQQWTAICALNYLYRVKLLYDLAEAYAMLKKSMKNLNLKHQPLMFWKRWKFHRQITSPFALSRDQDSRNQRNTKYVILFTVPVCFLPLKRMSILIKKNAHSNSENCDSIFTLNKEDKTWKQLFLYTETLPTAK